MSLKLISMNMEKLQSYLISFLFGLITSLGIGYVASGDFREFITRQSIDTAMFTGLVTLLALLAAMQQNFTLSKQSVRDRNFAYRLAVKSKFEDMGVVVIAKLLEIESRRAVCVSTIHNIKLCLDTGKVYHDGYNIMSTEAFNSDSCKASAALDVYFPDQSEKWNEIITTLNEMGSLASSILLTYKENDNGKLTTELLANMVIHQNSIEALNARIGNLPLEIRDSVVEQINTHTQNLTKLQP